MSTPSASVDVPVSLEAVSRVFGLGELVVAGHYAGADGAWQVRDQNTAYSLKLMAEDQPQWRLDALAESGNFELEADRAGVRLPAPLVPAHRAYGRAAQVEGYLVWMSRWLEGEPITVDEGASLSEWLGVTMATLHRLSPTSGDVRQAYGLHSQRDWAGWAGRGQAQGQSWADGLVTALPVIAEASALSEEAVAQQRHTAALCHRDIKPDNVLTTPDGFALCDFAYAGPDLPWLEATSVAASFGPPRPELLDTYERAGGPVGPTGRVGLGRWLGSTLNWLAFSTWVALGDRPVGDAEIRSAADRVPAVVAELTGRVERLDQVARQLFT